MTLTVENGSIVSGANTYSSRAVAIAYALARGIVLPDTTATDVNLIKGMDFIEGQTYPGIKSTTTQGTQFPRAYFYIDGILIANNAIPLLLIESQIEAAIADFQGYNQLAVSQRLIKSVQVGSIRKEYADGGISNAFPKALYNKLKKLLGNGNPNNGFEFKVSEG